MKEKRLTVFTYYFILSIHLLGCSEDTTRERNIFVEGSQNIQLAYEDDGSLNTYRTRIQELVDEANEAIQTLMPIDDLTIRIFDDASLTISGLGIGGYSPNGDDILIYLDARFNNLESVLNTRLPTILAHEMHHAKRQRTVGYGTTLFEAMVSEGLADHFSIEAIDVQPSEWSTALTEAELEQMIQLASQNWNDMSYDFPRWFFGTTTEIPVWAGYSIGFELVADYLSANPEAKPSMLFNESANSFLP